MFVSYLKHLWKFRQLVKQLALRDLKTRYKVSVLGFFWSLLRPLLTIVVLAGVFSMLDLRSARYNVSYPVLLLVSYMPWFFFSMTLLEGTQSLLSNAHLIKKVYSPREVYPGAVVLANLINFLLSLLVLIPILYLIFPVKFSWQFLQLPLVIAIHTLLLLGLCFMIASVNVLFRDMSQIMEFAVFVWFYLTPVLYDVWEIFLKLPRWAQILYFLHPMAGIVEWYRYVFLASELDPARKPDAVAIMPFLYYQAIPYAVIVSGGIFLAGYLLLKHLETRVVDTL